MVISLFEHWMTRLINISLNICITDVQGGPFNNGETINFSNSSQINRP